MIAHERCRSGSTAGTARPEAIPDATSAKDAVTESAASAGVAREFQYLLNDGVRFCAIERDRLQLSIRHGFILTVAAVLILSALCAALMTSVVLIIFGSAQGLAELFGGRVWLGYLLAGTLSIFEISATLIFAVSWWNRAAFRNTKLRYEETAGASVPAASERELLQAQAKASREQLHARMTSIKAAAVNSARANPLTTAAVAGSIAFMVARKFSVQPQKEPSNDGREEAPSERHLPVASIFEMLTQVLGALR